MRRITRLALATLAVVATTAFAQDKWPSKPATYVVPFPAGGTTDVLGRIIGQKLGPALGQTVVIENKPGAGGNIGSEFVAKAAPDGYTIGGGTVSSHAINPSLYPKMPYDAVKDFVPITLIGTNPLVLIVPANSKIQNVQELVAAAKAKPGTVTFASAGNGTSQHLSIESLKGAAGVNVIHVPYKGSGPAIADVMGGQVDAMFDTTVVAAPQIKAGKVRALAVTSAKRLKGFESIPTMQEAGVPGYEVTSWQGIFAPAGTPPAVVERLNAEIVKILKTPEMNERLEQLGMEPSANSAAEFAAFQKAEIAKWAKVVKDNNVRIE